MDESQFLVSLKPYLEAFTERSMDRRLSLLAQGLTPDAEIWGPKRVFAGYAEISEKIEGFHRNWPDCRLVMSSGVVSFSNAGHFAKAIVSQTGAVLASGHSVAELAPDGRIRRVLAFWGAPSPLPQSWPSHLSAPLATGGAGEA